VALQPDDRREQILDTAAEVWSERGVARVRVADIAGRIGVSVGLIPYHFGTKEEVIAAAFRRVAEQDLVRVTEVPDGDPAARIAHILELYLTDDPAWGLWLNAYGEAQHMPALHRTVLESSKVWHAAIEAEIRRGVEEGAWTCERPADSAAKVIAAIDGMGIHVALGMLDVDQPTALRWARSIVANELGISEDDLKRDTAP
jgi:AcrR family transcriptional regulator